MISLIRPGTLFTVTDYLKDKVYFPESIGVLSSIHPRDNIVWSLSALIIRRGKKGISRLERLEIGFPLIKSYNEKVIEYYESYNNIIHIEPIKNKNDVINDFTEMEFMAWSNAYVWYLDGLSRAIMGKKWLGLSRTDMSKAFNSNLNYKTSNTEPYYTAEEKVDLVTSIRVEETKLVRNAYYHQLNIYSGLNNTLSHTQALELCEKAERDEINRLIKMSKTKIANLSKIIGEYDA